MLKIGKLCLNEKEVTEARCGEDAWFLRFGFLDEHGREVEARVEHQEAPSFEHTLVGANFFRLTPEDRTLNAERPKEIYFNPARILHSKARPDGNFTVVFPLASISLTPTSYAALPKESSSLPLNWG